MSSWFRAVIPLALMLAWVAPAFGDESNACALADFAPPASFAITKGQISGAPGEHAPITRTIPRDGHDGTRVGYLVPGDKVDFVLACRGFSYVRYHGENRTTTGWIDSRNLQLQGQAFIPLPSNASQICSDVQGRMDSKWAAPPKQRDIPNDAKLTDESNAIESNPLSYQLINVQGRPLAVVQMSEGGTCYSILAKVWTSDFKRRLSPDDVESRNPSNLTIGGNAWAMALLEDVIVVDNQPLLRSVSYGRDFELSSIDKTGDTQLLCHGRLRPQLGKPILTEGDPNLCETLPEAATPVAMEPAAGKYKMPSQTEPNTIQEAAQWGMVDLDNSGQDRPVAVVNYTYASGAGCGSGFEGQVPILLHGEVVTADQVSAALKALYGDAADRGEVSGQLLVRIVRLGDQTYVELLDAELMATDEIGKAPVQSVWKFGPSGPTQVCKYRTRHFEVTPPSVREVAAPG